MASSWTAGHVLVPGFGLLFHIGSGPDSVFGVQLFELPEKHFLELVWCLCIESAQQFLALAFPELVTDVEKLVAAQEVLLPDLLQCNMQLLDLKDQ